MEYRFISTAEAAEILGVTPQRVTQLIKKGQLGAEMVGGRWLVDPSSVEARRRSASKKGGRPKAGEGRDDIRFTLMNRGHEVVEVVYNKRRRGFTSVGTFLDQDRAPLGVFGRKGASDVTSFDSWWRGRGIPSTRSGLQAILDAAKVDVPEELAMRNLGLSLSDQYWICPQGSDLAWEDINFFNNSIERASRETAAHSPISTPVRAHPDNTSDGNLSKQWLIEGGRRVLLKGGGTNNQEPYNEVVATALHRRLLNSGEFVPYSLSRRGSEVLCACEDFLTDEEEFIPATYVDRVLPDRADWNYYQHYVRCCDSIGVADIEPELWRMIVCDDIIANADRHYRNFGVVRNVETLACRPAPIFDSGSCLWIGTSLEDLRRGEFSFQSKQFDPSPARQLLLVEDMRWLETSALVGFADEAIGILAANPLLEERLPLIHTALERRIARIVDIREWG